MNVKSAGGAHRCALFLDRDGVINVHRSYVHERQQFAWSPGIFELGREAHLRGYAIVVVTNQAGIGHGLFTEAAFIELTLWMCSEMERHGAPITSVYYCPYHPQAVDEKFRQDHVWRKPSPGMILQARDDLDLDLSKSILFGDSGSDIAAAIQAGVGTTVLVGNNAPAEYTPTIIIPDIVTAFGWFVQCSQVSDGDRTLADGGEPALTATVQQRIAGPRNNFQAFQYQQV